MDPSGVFVLCIAAPRVFLFTAQVPQRASTAADHPVSFY